MTILLCFHTTVKFSIIHKSITLLETSSDISDTLIKNRRGPKTYPYQGLPNLIGRWLPSGQPSIAIWLPNNDWWLPNIARHEMVTFGG